MLAVRALDACLFVLGPPYRDNKKENEFAMNSFFYHCISSDKIV